VVFIIFLGQSQVTLLNPSNYHDIMFFILGVLPLVISTGAGANARNAIGTSVMGG